MKLFSENPYATVVGSALLIGSAISSAQAQRYDITDLGTAGGSHSRANGINENGVIAGWATGPNGGAVLWDQNGIIPIGSGLVTEAFAVNDAGQVVGYQEGFQQASQAYFYDNGVWTAIAMLPGTTHNRATDIDSAGRVVGQSYILGSALPDHAFLWDSGVLTDLGTLAGDYSRATGINNVEQVVGQTFVDLPSGERYLRGFLWENGAMIGLDPIEGTEVATEAYDINDAGAIVGSSWWYTTRFFHAKTATLWLPNTREAIDLGLVPAAGNPCGGGPVWNKSIALAINNHTQIVGSAMCIASGAPKAAFLWEDRVMYNLNDLIPAGSGWDLKSARDINDAGQIVGYGTAPNGELHGFLLTEMTQSCYPDCDQSTGAGVLDVFDFLCFQDSFVSADPYACDCDTSTGPGVCDVFDFLCFQNEFVAGCP